MAKHTKGPWTVGQYTPGPDFLAITNHCCICDPKTMALIATCGRADDRQSQIDADLIAAAPDLLAACQGMLRHIDDVLDDEDLMQRRAALMAAIKKATGEEGVA